MPAPTHYERLGIRPDAPVEEIRRAYRDVARLNHPDSAGSAVGADMAAVNEAWRVLSDPGRRARYDTTLRGPTVTYGPGTGTGGSAVPDSSRSDRSDLEEQLERLQRDSSGKFPKWPFVLIFILAAIFIFTAGAISQSPTPETPDKLLFAGSCVRIEANQDVVEVECGGAHDGVVVTLVDFDQTCPSGTQAHRDRQGRGWACIGPA